MAFADAGPFGDALVATLASLFYVANLVQPAILGPLAHLWSLSVEEHFYLFWPILASAVFFRLRFRGAVVALLVLLVVTEAVRASAYLGEKPLQLSHGAWVIDAYRFTLFRLDAILTGVLLAFLFSQGFRETSLLLRRPVLLGGVLCCFLAVLFLLAETNVYWRQGGFVGTNLLCGLLVAIAVANPDQLLLSNRVFRWIGRRSYGIYVYHFPIFAALEVLRREHSVMNFLLVSVLRFLVTLLVAELSFRFIEQPILRFKKRFEVPATVVPSSQ